MKTNFQQPEYSLPKTEPAIAISGGYQPFCVKAKLHPPKTTVKKVWAGIYGGHYDCIVFFKSKPKLSKKIIRLRMV